MAPRLYIWLAAGARELPRAQGLGLPLARMLYRAGPKGALQRARSAGGEARGGILGLTGPLGPEADVGRLARELAAECGRRGFRGVLLGLEASADRAARDGLAEGLGRLGVRCFAPMAPGGAPASMLVPSALGGGSFREMLAAAAGYGGDLSLEVARMCHDFAMPAYPPQGTPLTAARLRVIIEAHRPTPYFSDAMQCRYFTYRAEDGPHFVLFDDVKSARGKIELARDAGFRDAFVHYGQWGDSAAGIFRPLQG